MGEEIPSLIGSGSVLEEMLMCRLAMLKQDNKAYWQRSRTK